MNNSLFQQFQLVPFSGPGEFLDPEKEAYFSVRIDACGAGEYSIHCADNHLARVFLLPLRGRDPREATTAVALDNFSVTLWDFIWRERKGVSPMDQFAQVVVTVEQWLRESQRFADLCTLKIPHGFFLDAKLCLTNRNEWAYVPGYSPPLGSWSMMEGDGEIVSMDSTPISELANSTNKFSPAFITSWIQPVTVAYRMVRQFIDGKVLVRDMLAHVEPAVRQRPKRMDLESVSDDLLALLPA
jgi:hypothetical protein